ncbi:MAG: preprotein translocase subunit YajC [Methylophilaceae bacterium]|jgi:preprotein translocase subunit YajC
MISLAYANSATAPGGLMSFVPFIIIFILFYFMLIRPQMKQAKDHKKLISELKKGDEVMLASGMMGTIEKVSDLYIILNVANDTNVKFQKNSVQTVLPKGTIKSI